MTPNELIALIAGPAFGASAAWFLNSRTVRSMALETRVRELEVEQPRLRAEVVARLTAIEHRLGELIEALQNRA